MAWFSASVFADRVLLSTGFANGVSMIPIAALGSLPINQPLAKWAIAQIIQNAPQIQAVVDDPLGTVARVGDLLVWQGETGSQVIGALESL